MHDFADGSSQLFRWRRFGSWRLGIRCRGGLRRRLEAQPLRMRLEEKIAVQFELQASQSWRWQARCAFPAREIDDQSHQDHSHEQCSGNGPAFYRRNAEARRFRFSWYRSCRRLQPRLNFCDRAAPLGIEMQALTRNSAERRRNGFRRIGIAAQASRLQTLRSA